MKDWLRQARLIISSPGQPPREEAIFDGASIGSAAENSLRVEGAGVGRYHLLIEKRKDGFWARELNWAQETTINGAPLGGERRLTDGDRMRLGEETEIEFYLAVGAARRSPRVRPGATPGVGGAASKIARASASSEGRTFRLALWIMSVLIVVTVVVVAVGKYIPGPSCREAVEILSPPDGQTISGRVPVKLRKGECVKRIFWRLDQQEIFLPDELWLDPAQLEKQFPGLGDKAHELKVLGEDGRGREVPGSSIKVIFAKNLVGPDELREMLKPFAEKVAPGQQFTEDFISEIGRRTNYTPEMVGQVAEASSDLCRTFFVQGLPSELGPSLALSRQRLADQSPPPNEEWERYSLWHLPQRSLRGWLKPQETEDALREGRRAAEIAADYLKRLQVVLTSNVSSNERDFTYSVACFGMDLDVARQQIASRLSASGEEYRNFWAMKEHLGNLLPAGAAERVADFFAAGVVASNPARFNLPVQPFACEQ